MRHDTVPYDGATWAADEAIARAANADPERAARLVAETLAMVDRAPYPALVRDARRFGTDAVHGFGDADPERAIEFLRLLRHVIEEMERLDAAERAAATA